MAAISTAKHLSLINKIKVLFIDAQPAEKPKDILQDHADQLQRIFEKYNGLLQELNNMIKEYEATQRKAKVRLRKQQLLQAKKHNTKKLIV